MSEYLLKENLSLNKRADNKKEEIDFKILDGLRGIAAVYVVFNHSRGNLFIGGVKYSEIKSRELWSFFEKTYFSALQLTSLGREFVILFFILSGFSIAFSLSKIPTISSFYFRRVVRIYPPYIIALVWAFSIFIVLQNFMPEVLLKNSKSVFSSLGGIIKNLVYIDNGYLIPQFWSLKFEVLFYLMVPFFIMKKDFYFLASVIIALVSFCISWNNDTATSIIGQYILDYNIYFAIGVFCFTYYEATSKKLVFNNKYTFYIVAFLLFLTMIIFKFWVQFDMNKISLLLASLFSITLLFNFLHHKIKNKILMFLGSISYTMYITHFASLMLLKGILLRTGAINSVDIQNKYLWMAGIPFAIAISYVFYVLVEKSTKSYLAKIRSRKINN